MDTQNNEHMTGKILQGMILGPKFSTLPLDVRKRFSQHYNTKVTSSYEAAWAMIYAANIEFEETLNVDFSSSLASYMEETCQTQNRYIKETLDESLLFSNLSKLKNCLIRFLELSLKTPGGHMSELSLEELGLSQIDQDFFAHIIQNQTMEKFFIHVRRNNWYQIVTGKIGSDSLYEILMRSEKFSPKSCDLMLCKDINTLLIDPAVRSYISSFYENSVLNKQLTKDKINEYLQNIENLPLAWVLM